MIIVDDLDILIKPMEPDITQARVTRDSSGIRLKSSLLIILAASPEYGGVVKGRSVDVGPNVLGLDWRSFGVDFRSSISPLSQRQLGER